MDAQFDNDGYEHGIDFKHNNNISKPIGYDNGIDGDFHDDSGDYSMNGGYDDSVHTDSFSEQIQSIKQDLVQENKDSYHGLDIDSRNLNESAGHSPDGKTHSTADDVIEDGKPGEAIAAPDVAPSAAPEVAPSAAPEVAPSDGAQTKPAQKTDPKAASKSTPVKKEVKSKVDTRSPVTSAKTRPASASTAPKTATGKVAPAKPKPELSSTVPKHTKATAPSSAKPKDAAVTGDSKTAPAKATTATKKPLSASTLGGRPQSGGPKKETASGTLNKTISNVRGSADVTKKDAPGLNKTVLGASSTANKPGSAGLRKKPEEKGEQKSTGSAPRVGSAAHSGVQRKPLHTGASTGQSKDPAEAGVNGSTSGKKEPKKPIAVVKPTTPNKPKEAKPTPRPNSGVNSTQNKANTTVSKPGVTDKRPASGTTITKQKSMDTKSTPAAPGDKRPISATSKPAAAKTGPSAADKAHNTTVSGKKPNEASSTTTKPRLNSASKKPTDKPESAKATDSKPGSRPADKQPHNKATNEQAAKAAAKVTSKPTSATNKAAAKSTAGQSAKDAKHAAAKTTAKTSKQEPKQQANVKVGSAEKPADAEKACLSGDKGNPYYAQELEQGATIENTDLQEACFNQTSAVGQGQVEGQPESDVMSTIAHITGKFGNPHYLEELTRGESIQSSDTTQSHDAPRVETCYTEYHYRHMPEPKTSDSIETQDSEKPAEDNGDYPDEMHYHNIPQPKYTIPCTAETISQTAAPKTPTSAALDPSVQEAVELLIQADTAPVTGDKGNPHYAAELEKINPGQIAANSAHPCKTGQGVVEDNTMPDEAHPTGDKGNPYYKAELEQSASKQEDITSTSKSEDVQPTLKTEDVKPVEIN